MGQYCETVHSSHNTERSANYLLSSAWPWPYRLLLSIQQVSTQLSVLTILSVDHLLREHQWLQLNHRFLVLLPTLLLKLLCVPSRASLAWLVLLVILVLQDFVVHLDVFSSVNQLK